MTTKKIARKFRDDVLKAMSGWHTIPPMFGEARTQQEADQAFFNALVKAIQDFEENALPREQWRVNHEFGKEPEWAKACTPLKTIQWEGKYPTKEEIAALTPEQITEIFKNAKSCPTFDKSMKDVDLSNIPRAEDILKSRDNEELLSKIEALLQESAEKFKKAPALSTAEAYEFGKCGAYQTVIDLIKNQK